MGIVRFHTTVVNFLYVLGGIGFLDDEDYMKLPDTKAIWITLYGDQYHEQAVSRAAVPYYYIGRRS